MEFIQVTKENLEKEHICCAISNNKDIQVMTSGENSDIVKLELESDLKRYIKEQQINNPLYMSKVVSENDHNNFIRLCRSSVARGKRYCQ